MWPWVWIGISVKKIGCAYFKANCWISWIARRYQYLQYTSIYTVFQDLPHQTNLSVLYISKDISTMESMELPNSIPMSVCLEIWHPACPHLSSFSSLELQFWEHRQFDTYAKYAKIIFNKNCQDNPALNAHNVLCSQIPMNYPLKKISLKRLTQTFLTPEVDTIISPMVFARQCERHRLNFFWGSWFDAVSLVIKYDLQYIYIYIY